ncbi:MAG: phosphatidylserine decarboxylase [Acidobacteria bacterium]|nr:phosphatidylserine decarboxylase [Acidobacteriota bacterium]
MRIDRAGWLFVVPPAVLAAAGALMGFWVLAAPMAAVAGFMVFFFRDPDRTIPDEPGLVIAPSDGRVLIAGDADPAVAPPGVWTQVSVFLSPIDVHINRIPVDGRVTKIEYKPGRFLAAYRWEAASANERNDVWIDHAGEAIVCRQVVGVLARRLVCRIGVGDDVRTGDRYGLMKFGSRIDLFLPRHVRLRVGQGDRIRGGETVVASW